MIKKLTLFLILVAPMLFAAKGYELVKEQSIFNGDKIFEYKLPNGLQVLFVPRHQAKVLTFQTWFRVGSLNEKLSKLERTGLAHLFEHMMFRGSENYPDGVFDKMTSRMGAEKQNATTSFYRTNYFQSIPSNQLAKLMELESDRMQNLKLTPEIFEKEKGAVVGELRRHNDSPMSFAYEGLLKLAYEQAPYRFTVIGTEEEIKGFKNEEAQYFYKTFYAPNNATLIVVGDTEENILMPLVVKYYGGMASQEIPAMKMPEEPVQKKERRMEKTHPQATSEIMLMAYKTEPVTSKDFVPLALLSSHISNGMESRFRKRLVDSHIAVHAGASTNGRPDIFEVYAQLTEKKKADDALRVIDEEFARYARVALTKKELERARNQELLDMYSAVGDNAQLANLLGDFLALSGNYMRAFEVIEGYKTVTPKDIQQVAKKYLNKNNRSIFVVQPENKAAAKKAK